MAIAPNTAVTAKLRSTALMALLPIAFDGVFLTIAGRQVLANKDGPGKKVSAEFCTTDMASSCWRARHPLVHGAPLAIWHFLRYTRDGNIVQDDDPAAAKIPLTFYRTAQQRAGTGLVEGIG
jgi:hypothetical protein